jgi:aspartate kinase
MGVVVQKYGGSSVADIEKLGRVADQIVATKAQGHDVVVVVSAMGKTTDNLLALAQDAAKGNATKGEVPKRELDMLLSTGERVSMALLSIAISARGFDAVSFTGSQSGIITNDRHFDARIIEVRPHRIEDELSRGRIVIVAGYQGMSYKREITTLGRGGSDTTAVALAAALGAERCEIYSDVDGVYSADPRVVPAATHLPELDYATMQEMAECGAKVLNAQAVEWARRNKVALFARRTGDSLASDGWKETRVSSDASASQRAVVVARSVVIVRTARASAKRLFAILSEHGVALGDLCISEEKAVCWAPLVNVPSWGEVKRALEAGGLDELAIDEGHGALSLCGVEIGSQPELVTRALGLLTTPPCETFSHPLRLTCLLPVDALENAAMVWHGSLGPGRDEAARLTA